MKFDWFKYLKKGYCKSVKFYWLLQWKLTDLTVKISFPLVQLVIINWFNSEIYFLTGESVKSQITDSISKNFTDSDLESNIYRQVSHVYKKVVNFTWISVKFTEILCCHYFNLWIQLMQQFFKIFTDRFSECELFLFSGSNSFDKKVILFFYASGINK